MLGDSIRRRRGRRPPGSAQDAWEEQRREQGTSGGDDGPGWPRRLALGAALLVVFFGIGWLVATRVLYPPIDAGGDHVAAPDVSGLPVDEARIRLESAGLRLGEMVDLPHPEAPAGRVVAQTPLAGQGLRPGASVDVGVSAGAPRLRIPDLVGFPGETARRVLEAAGAEVTARQSEDPAPQGRVLAIDPEPGTEHELPLAVTLVVSTGPPPDSLGLDSLGVRVPVPVIPPR